MARQPLPIALEVVPETETSYTESVRALAQATSLLLTIERRRLGKEAALQAQSNQTGKMAA